MTSRGELLGLIQSQCVATLIRINSITVCDPSVTHLYSSVCRCGSSMSSWVIRVDDLVSCPSYPKAFIFRRLYYSRSLLRRHPCYMAGSALQKSKLQASTEIVQRYEVPKRESTGGHVNYRCENLTTNVSYTPISAAQKACDRT